MTDIQIIQVIGLVFLLTGTGAFANQGLLRKMLHEFGKNSGLAYMGGLMALVIGFLLLNSRHVFRPGITSDFLTIIGWIAFAKGVILIAFPEWTKAIAAHFEKAKYIDYIHIPLFIFGLILLLIAFI